MVVVGRIYTMVCEACGHRDKHYLASGQEGWNYICPSCKDGIYTIIRMARTPHYNFQPFMTEDITGEPVEITSPTHRDSLLSDNNLTMDKVSDLDKRKSRHAYEVSAARHVTYDNIMQELKRAKG